MVYGRANGPARCLLARARPGPQILQLFSGWAGPRHTFCGPHNSICEPGPGRVCTTAAGPGRAWASSHTCGPGLDLNCRPVQSLTMQCITVWTFRKHKARKTLRKWRRICIIITVHHDMSFRHSRCSYKLSYRVSINAETFASVANV